MAAPAGEQRRKNALNSLADDSIIGVDPSAKRARAADELSRY
jgi:hypothetical protein